MKRWVLLILLVAVPAVASVPLYPPSFKIFYNTGITNSGVSGGASGDGLLLETGDYLLLETGDYFLLE